MTNRKGPKDPESEAAMEVVAMQQKHEQLADLQLKKRERSIAMLFEEIGKIKAMNFNRGQSEFFALILLKRLKDGKTYKDMDMTWNQTCETCGISRRTVDEKLADLKPFKADFLGGFAGFSGFDFNKIKYLAEDKTGGIAEIRGSTIIYNGQEIPISADRKEDIQAVIEQIEKDYKTRAEEAEANLKAVKRGLRDKDLLLEKKNKEIDRYAGKARSQDLTPEEDGFLARMEQARIGFDGYMLGAEPTRMDALTSAPGEESHVTPRMRAAYIELLGYMKRQVIAAHDTAVEMFGADLEEGRL